MSELNTNMFLAIPLPDSVQVYINEMALQLQSEYPFKSWVSLGDYHITLVFLGKVDTRRLQHPQKALPSVIRHHHPIHITVDRIGTFGKKRRPSVLWAGITENKALIDLQKDIDATCAEVGFELDKRPYHPHITLARKWNSPDSLEASEFAKDLNPDSERGSWTANEVVLLQSHPNKTPMYKAVKRLPLKETFS